MKDGTQSKIITLAWSRETQPYEHLRMHVFSSGWPHPYSTWSGWDFVTPALRITPQRSPLPQNLHTHSTCFSSPNLGKNGDNGTFYLIISVLSMHFHMLFSVSYFLKGCLLGNSFGRNIGVGFALNLLSSQPTLHSGAHMCFYVGMLIGPYLGYGPFCPGLMVSGSCAYFRDF